MWGEGGGVELPAGDDGATGSYRTARPVAHWNAVIRNRLLGSIFSAQGASRIVALQAPAGHGKTSLMVQAESVCREQGYLTAWLTVNASDDDASRLSDLLHQLAEDVSVRWQNGADTAPLDTPPGGRGRLDMRFAKIDHPAALFIDDLHFLRNKAATRLLLDLLARPNPMLRWFIGSRQPLPEETQLVAGGDALILRAQDLCFSAAEAREFFGQIGGPSMSDGELAGILQATEGWPAALQLYRLALRATRVLGRPWEAPDPRGQGLAEYLGQNVLEFQEPEVQHFMVTTSVLDRMCAELCDALLDRTDSAELLTLVERRGLFLRKLGSSEGWFTYHAVFSGFLRTQLLRNDPETLRNLHRRAAAWFASHGHFEDAMHHYTASEDYSTAADVLDRWIDTLVPSGYMATVDRWLDETPREELLRRPSLLVKVLWALAFLSRNHKIGPTLDLWHEATQRNGNAGGADPKIMLCIVDILADRLVESRRHIIDSDTSGEGDTRFGTFELGVICNARGYADMAEGDFDSALAQFDRGQLLNAKAGAKFALAYSMGKAALVRLSQGHAREAIERIRSAREATNQNMEGSLAEACLICAHIAALYEAGELDEALVEFERDRELIELGAIHDYLVLAFRAVARIHDMRGDTATAAQILKHGQGVAHARLWPRAAHLLALEEVRRTLIVGDVALAEVLLRGNQYSTGDLPGVVRVSAEVEDDMISAVRLLVAQGHTTEALDLLRQELSLARKQGRVLRQIKLCTLAAMAEQASGNGRAAHRQIHEALTLAVPGGCRQSILDEGVGVDALIEEHRAILESTPEALPPETQQLVDALTPQANRQDGESVDAPRRGESEDVVAEILTERELEVLRLLTRHFSNNQIAQTLFVTLDTVKYHLKNIYAKFGVRRRAEAIAIARRLDIE